MADAVASPGDPEAPVSFTDTNAETSATGKKTVANKQKSGSTPPTPPPVGASASGTNVVTKQTQETDDSNTRSDKTDKKKKKGKKKMKKKKKKKTAHFKKRGNPIFKILFLVFAAIALICIIGAIVCGIVLAHEAS